MHARGGNQKRWDPFCLLRVALQLPSGSYFPTASLLASTSDSTPVSRIFCIVVR